MQTAREMFGKSFFSLGVDEKIAVNNAVGGSVRGNFQAMTLDFLTGQEVPKNAPEQPKGKQSAGFLGSNLKPQA
jgi:hypothetical protein